MEVKNFTNLETTFLSKLNEGFKTFDDLKENVPFNEKTLSGIIESMISKNIIKFDNVTKEYMYATVVEGKVVILDGNIMLPMTIIKCPDKLLVSRGIWYEFPLDFDIRRIVWNIQLPSKNKSSLVELIQQSVLKPKKSKIIQLPERTNLVNKLIPWNEHIKLKINVVGEDYTDVSILFVERIYIDESKMDFVEFRDFSVGTEIVTSEMIEELMKPAEERNYENIKLNRIYNFSDFIYSNNCIPYLIDEESICYAKITAIKSKFELTYYRFDNLGGTQKLSVDEFIDPSEGISKIKELFDGYVHNRLLSHDFLIEASE